MNVEKALTQSCDVFFYDLSLQFPLQNLDVFTKQNMLTVPTGIDLPGERAGFFPTEKWFRKNYGKYISITGQKVNIAIGQGELLVTPLQICAYYAALGNEGKWIKPHFLMKTVDENGSNLISYESQQLPVSAKNLNLIKKALYKVVNEKYGTGTRAFVQGVNVYGKTGSAENHMGEKTHAWFAGFAEWEKPEIAFVIFLENAGHGGSQAAPLAGKIVEFYDKLRKS
jgi:penicillin-binding protein 2